MLMLTGAVFQLNIISGNTDIIKNYWLSYDTHMPEGTVSGFQAVSLVKLASSKGTHILINLSACAYFFSPENFQKIPGTYNVSPLFFSLPSTVQ